MAFCTFQTKWSITYNKCHQLSWKPWNRNVYLLCIIMSQQAYNYVSRSLFMYVQGNQPNVNLGNKLRRRGGRDHTEKQQRWNTYTAVPSTPCGWHSRCRTSVQRRTERVNVNYQQCYTPPPRNTILVIPISFSISPKNKNKTKSTLKRSAAIHK